MKRLIRSFPSAYRTTFAAFVSWWICAAANAQNVPIDVSRYSPLCGVEVRSEGNRVNIVWPMADGEFGRVALNLNSRKPLIENLGIANSATGKAEPILHDIEPVTFLTVGTREAPSGRPPTMSVWNVFFDKPAKRPFQTHVSQLELKQVRVTSEGRHATVAVGNLTLGSFSGELQFTFYASSRLVHVEAVVSTPEDRRAILYDAGLTGESPGWQRIAWMDTERRWQRTAVEKKSEMTNDVFSCAKATLFPLKPSAAPHWTPSERWRDGVMV